jgi:hypothetical protein
VGGPSRWILGITPNGGTQPIQVLAKAETLTTNDIVLINTTATPNGSISVVVDNTTNPFTLLKVQ